MRLGSGIVFLGALLGATSAGAAGTDMEIFEKRVQKYTIGTGDVFDKPKSLCACINDPGNTDNNGTAGVLESGIITTGDLPPGRVRVRCMVMKGDANGTISQTEICEEWVPLAR